jgi:hypothetical protein
MTENAQAERWGMGMSYEPQRRKEGRESDMEMHRRKGYEMRGEIHNFNKDKYKNIKKDRGIMLKIEKITSS